MNAKKASVLPRHSSVTSSVDSTLEVAGSVGQTVNQLDWILN